MTVEFDTTGLATGDNAGLALLCNPYVWIGVVKSTNGDGIADVCRFWRTRWRTPRRWRRRLQTALPPSAPALLPAIFGFAFIATSTPTRPSSVGAPTASNLRLLGNPWPIPGFQLQTFQGVRPSLFNFNTSGKPGGYADFDNYTVVEPRARGIEREIPTGKTITLTSGADGSYLAADTQNNLLINSTNAAAQDTHFHVVDLGLGRVAFKASNGRFVSASENGVILKVVAGKKFSEAESFQWINLIRGDTAFMNLVNHRYLATKPNQPGPVTANATDVTPARKSGVEFKWKTVE